MLCLYALRTEGKTFASDLSADAQKAILRNTLLHTMSSIASGFDYDIPVFWVHKLEDFNFSIRDLIGEGCNTILAMAGESDPKFRPSLRKIIYLQRVGAFRHKWSSGREKMEKEWGEYFSAAPFLYVETYHSGLDWLLYPDTHLFTQKVDDLVADAHQFPAYFRRCKAADAALKAALPQSSAKRLRSLRFPSKLRVEDVEPTPLSDQIKYELRSYRSADR